MLQFKTGTNISHFKAVDSRRFCYFYIFTNFPIPAGKCREMVSNPEASRKPRKSLSRSPLPAITPARDEYGTMHTGTKPSCIGTFRIYVRTERKSAKEFNIIFRYYFGLNFLARVVDGWVRATTKIIIVNLH